MNSTHYRSNRILILLLGLIASYSVLAQDVEVTGAEPGAAPPATYGLDVVISGTGFDKSAKVNFLKSDTGKPADIIVNRSKVNSSSQITVNIDVSDLATDANYDIEVKMSRGRGGKGTTLFKIDSTGTVAPNNDGQSIEMTCVLNDDSNTLATVRNDAGLNFLGGQFYEGGMEKVGCLSGGVVSDRLAGLRFSTGATNLKNSIRFVDLDFEPCDPNDINCPLGDFKLLDEIRGRLPTDLLNPTLDTVQIDVRPYSGVPGHDHIHLMEASLFDPYMPYMMKMHMELEGLSERYHVQMVNSTELPPGELQSHACPYDAIDVNNEPDDINVYIWQDGVYSGPPQDGLPDGYTITTGVIVSPESAGVPPTVKAEFAHGLLCSNISLEGEPCPGGKKNRDRLCHVLGRVPMRFTMHMEYQ